MIDTQDMAYDSDSDDEKIENVAEEPMYDESHKDIIAKYKRSRNAWQTIFDKYIDDCKFANGEQWDDRIKAKREKQYLQCLVYDKISPIITQVANQMRKNSAAIKCAPVSDGANKNTAKVYDGLIKRIQYNSNAHVIYSSVGRNILTGGIGAFKVEIDDDNKPILERIKDPTKIIVDPSADRANFSDAQFIFEEKWITKKTYERLFDEDSVGIGNSTNSDMFRADSVLILEYWCKDVKQVLDVHSITTVYKYVLNGEKILKKYEWVGSYIPIIFVTGEEVFIEEEREYKGIVRGIKDAQRLLNLSKSRTGDYLQRSSTPQWLATTNNISDNVEKWNESNVNGDPVLTYTPDSGEKPQRLEAPAPPSGFQSISQEADVDMRNSVGVGDPNAQVPDNISSKTLELHLAQANIGTFGYVDNVNNAIKYAGEILVDLIPKLYTDAQIVEIMGYDGNISTVPLNQPYEENGQVVEHNLASGKYTVLISKGPSYESQRAEALDKLMDLVKVTPEFMSVAGDIIFRNMDFEGSEEIADRLKAQIPPNILAASNPTNGDNQSQVLQNNLQQMQQQLEMLNQQNQQLNQAIMQMNQEKQAKIAEINAKGEYDLKLKQMELEYQLKIETMKQEAKSHQIAQQGIVDLEKINEQHETALKLDIHKTHGQLLMKEIDHNRQM